MKNVLTSLETKLALQHAVHDSVVLARVGAIDLDVKHVRNLAH